ncbi:chaperonin 10-like protein [Flagelloscypha sp. PMI_526]|nr:chaperonin 10-like protein [Flagelloscypha sp. PMI_526]
MAALEYDVFRGNKDGHIHKTTTKRGPLERDEVLVKITHSGLCYTDVHYRASGCALGHEGVGLVDKLGPDVRGLQLGQHVGWGYQHDTCGHCEQCLLGDDMYCPEAVLYGVKDLDQGSFATHIVIRESFLIRIPDSIPLEYAGPLMCGGITVFEPMFRYGVKSTDRVGVLGLGGLCHHFSLDLAILRSSFYLRWAAKSSFSVTRITRRMKHLSLVPQEFYATKGVKAGELQAGETANKLFVTTSSPPNWDLYLPILAPHAVIFPILVGRRHSFIPMFSFAAQHNIKPMIEMFEMSEEGLTKAFERLAEGSLRYRAVLEWK